MTRWCTIAVLLLSGIGLGGCPQIEGGAVEVAWMVQRADGHSAECKDVWLAGNQKIDRIRLRVTPEDDPGLDLCAGVEPPSICEFSCEGGGGATDFDIPEGVYFFDLVPLTADGPVTSPSVVAVPAPLRRSIVEGDITDLGIWQMVILNDVRAN